MQVVISDDGRGICAGTGARGLGAGLRLIAEWADDFAFSARHPHGLEV